MGQFTLSGQIPGILTSQVGVPVALHTVGPLALTGVQVDAYLIESAAADTVVRIGDGVSDHVLTILAGQKYASDVLVGVVWPPAAVLELEVTSAPGFEASTLGVNVLATDSQAPAVSGAGLVTLDQLKTALGLGLAPHAADAWFSRQITVVSELIRTYCRRHFNQATIDSFWHCPDVVMSADYPLESIVSASIDGVAVDVAADLAFNPTNGMIWRKFGTSRRSFRGVEELTIRYIAGTDPVPATVAECVFVGIAEKFSSYDVDQGLGGQQTPIGVTFPEGAGAIRFANAAQLEQGDLVHYLAGFPLGLLEPYVDHSRIHAQSDQYWTFV